MKREYMQPTIETSKVSCFEEIFACREEDDKCYNTSGEKGSKPGQGWPWYPWCK
jgi:hypothetical protein